MPHYMLYVQLFFFLLLNLIYLLDNYSSACPQESKHFTYDTAYLTLDYMLYVQLFLFFFAFKSHLLGNYSTACSQESK